MRHNVLTPRSSRGVRGRRGRRASVRNQEVWVKASGVFYVHSSPPALCPHVEWALAGVPGGPANLAWTDPAAAPGTVPAARCLEGNPRTPAALASPLRPWQVPPVAVPQAPTPRCAGT